MNDCRIRIVKQLFQRKKKLLKCITELFQTTISFTCVLDLTFWYFYGKTRQIKQGGGCVGDNCGLTGDSSTTHTQAVSDDHSVGISRKNWGRGGQMSKPI